MTGNYPDVPGPRMAYDKDGTQVYSGPSYTQITVQLTQAQMASLNGEGPGSYTEPNSATFQYGRFFWIFPEKRDLLGLFYAGVNSSDGVQVSADTTNGIDGTWTNLSGVAIGTGSRTSMRTGIQTVTGANGIKGVRTGIMHASGSNATLYTMHLYGKISAGENPNRLAFWHPTADAALSGYPAHFDWGDRPRGTTATKQFRIKNLSSTLTASTITLGVEALTDTTPAVAPMHTLSTDGINFAPTATIASLGPGAISPIITIQQNLSLSAVLSLWNQRIYSTVGGWA